jgi:hypothetical protein
VVVERDQLLYKDIICATGPGARTTTAEMPAGADNQADQGSLFQEEASSDQHHLVNS